MWQSFFRSVSYDNGSKLTPEHKAVHGQIFMSAKRQKRLLGDEEFNMKTDFLEFAKEKLYVGGSLNPLRERGSR